jgi:ubiquinone/menaquinone biosynthesis C-methylase UbiE
VSAADFYSRWAEVYDAVADVPGVAGLRRRLAAALAPSPGAVVLEAGCGTGANFPHLRRRVGPDGAVVGVDYSPGMLAVARRRIDRAGWRNVGVVRGDAARPPVREAGAVVASFLSGMLDDPAAAVRAWADVAGPGGRLALLDLGRSTGAGRPLNPLFRLFVRASAPPESRWSRDVDPTAALERRLVAAHRAVEAVCTDVERATGALGFARITAGTVV